jgi:hypothetical protein
MDLLKKIQRNRRENEFNVECPKDNRFEPGLREEYFRCTDDSAIISNIALFSYSSTIAISIFFIRLGNQ